MSLHAFLAWEEAQVRMAEIGVDVPVADFYLDVPFPDQPEATDP